MTYFRQYLGHYRIHAGTGPKKLYYMPVFTVFLLVSCWFVHFHTLYDVSFKC